MSQNNPTSAIPAIDGDVRIAIVRAEWNDKITGALTESARRVFDSYEGASLTYDVFTVPGAIELTFAASQLIETGQFDAVVVFGCVIRGGTPHFDYVCQSVTQGVTALNVDCDTPVIFGVLTVDNEQDALDRTSDGPMGDKGAEAAETALKMVAFRRHVEDNI